MLQQTRVRTVLPYYDRFLRRFPDYHALAEAAEEEVLFLWAGLGYYRRARNLRKAAIRIVRECNGIFPETLEQIEQLPGVGRYTSRAIFSIAFNQPVPVVDGNVRRVIGRLRSIEAATERYYWDQAECLLSKDQPAEFNQAFMELGALVCLPSIPRCQECPVRRLCHTGGKGRTALPSGKSRRPQERIVMVLLVLECGGRLALVRQPDSGFIPGKWGVPIRFLTAGQQPRPAAVRLARRLSGMQVELRSHSIISHSITHRRIRGHVYHAVFAPPFPPAPADGGVRWSSRKQAARLLVSSLYAKSLAAVFQLSVVSRKRSAVSQS